LYSTESKSSSKKKNTRRWRSWDLGRDIELYYHVISLSLKTNYLSILWANNVLDNAFSAAFILRSADKLVTSYERRRHLGSSIGLL
jgi:hypothetical protein